MNLAELSYNLYKIGAFRVGEFKLKSGDLSPFYLDLRLIPSYPDLFKEVITTYCAIIDKISSKVDSVAGIMSAGVPFATGIALERNLPLLQIRNQPKGHGTKKVVEGSVVSGTTSVLIDDLISTGASKLNPARALRSHGVNVRDLVVLVDRTYDDSVSNLLEEEGISLHAAMTLRDLLNGLESANLQKDEIEKVKSAFEQWSGK